MAGTVLGVIDCFTGAAGSVYRLTRAGVCFKLNDEAPQRVQAFQLVVEFGKDRG